MKCCLHLPLLRVHICPYCCCRVNTGGREGRDWRVKEIGLKDRKRWSWRAEDEEGEEMAIVASMDRERVRGCEGQVWREGPDTQDREKGSAEVSRRGEASKNLTLGSVRGQAVDLSRWTECGTLEE